MYKKLKSFWNLFRERCENKLKDESMLFENAEDAGAKKVFRSENINNKYIFRYFN